MSARRWDQPDLLIDVTASAVNRADVLQRQGFYEIQLGPRSFGSYGRQSATVRNTFEYLVVVPEVCFQTAFARQSRQSIMVSALQGRSLKEYDF
ncbi:hypothetical protein C1J01_12825 [Nonomuraea aridisoli]|uniref:Uncharacterized protein n=1 Tax=Nonomuraea aridisoli TaxID=2070368 RepID=A0A2W2ER10_9ACTN|nr:hypothetical protein C1J01_12825 [Nonomuraea aridisoli]